MGQFEFFDHTADLGVRVSAKSLKDFFITAARAMFSAVVGDTSSPTGHCRREVALSGDTLEDLLVSWLNELLFLLDTRRVLPVAYEFSIVQNAKGYSLSCFMDCVRIPPSAIVQEVKSATYHGLRVENREGVFTAEVILDV